jgi:hypothetical protein
VIRFRRLLALLAAVGVGWACAGCASTQDESDLPWNMPQSWESAPSLPGSMGSGY